MQKMQLRWEIYIEEKISVESRLCGPLWVPKWLFIGGKNSEIAMNFK